VLAGHGKNENYWEMRVNNLVIGQALRGTQATQIIHANRSVKELFFSKLASAAVCTRPVNEMLCCSHRVFDCAAAAHL